MYAIEMEFNKSSKVLTSCKILPLNLKVSCLPIWIGIALTSRFSRNRGPIEKKIKKKNKEFIKGQRSDGKMQSAFWYSHSMTDGKDKKSF